MSHSDLTIGDIRSFVLEQFPRARELNIADGDSLLENGIIDSLGVLEVVEFIEGRFDITLTDDEMVADHFESIASLAAFVRAKEQHNGDGRWS